ncbi:MAG: hypothetical protein ACKVP5_20655 [Aestuariivirga sp.]
MKSAGTNSKSEAVRIALLTLARIGNQVSLHHPRLHQNCHRRTCSGDPSRDIFRQLPLWRNGSPQQVRG